MKSAVPHRGRDMDAAIGATLLAGVLVSVALIAAGLAWHWLVHGDATLRYELPATTVAGFLAADVEQVAAGATRPRLLVNLGLVVLLLTPYVRVLASVLSFAHQKNWKYVGFTAFVLATLTYSLFT